MPALITAFIFTLFDASIGWWVLFAIILFIEMMVTFS
jgi:hypothetical protein